MAEIPKVGVRELRSKLATYLNSGEPIAIVRHGQTIGYYVPTSESENSLELETLKQAASKLNSLLEQHSS
ncbi:MAG: type II toxin-antitoxin system Phd/YefM family antitoxin [Xenococcaceae cyanobacterium MO_207.B15]|nr:type II toxin-antitoxin system Phd/YefM family antitoxin [Xenococcaceae cyanobacterium MO_207.B15]